MQDVQTSNDHVESSDPAAPPRRNRPKVGIARATCPVCKSPDRSDKVSNVVRSGRGKPTFGSGETAKYETELAELLGEPPQPWATPLTRVALNALLPLVTLLGLLLALSLIRAQDYVVVSERRSRSRGTSGSPSLAS